MDSAPRHDALEQLAAVPGVVGSMVFDASGVVASAFPPVFDAAGLRLLAGQLAGDAYFNEWMAGDGAVLDLRYRDGHVVVRAIGGAWLLALTTAQANAQLLAMSLTQVVRRLRLPVRAAGAAARGAAPRSPAAAPGGAPSTLDRLRALVSAELGEHAAKALEILAAAGPKPKDLLRATSEIEKMTRLFISKTKAEEIGQGLREILEP